MYLEDIIVFSSNIEDLRAHLRTVLQVLEAAGVTSRLSKSKLFYIEVDYLRHVINPST